MPPVPDLSYPAHSELVRRIIFAHVAETGEPITMLNLVLALVDLGVIRLRPNSVMHLFPSHPHRMAAAEIVKQLYQEGRLAGLADIEAAYRAGPRERYLALHRQCIEAQTP